MAKLCGASKERRYYENFLVRSNHCHPGHHRKCSQSAGPYPSAPADHNARGDRLTGLRPVANQERQKLLNAIDHSLRYIDTNTAQADYAAVQVPGFSREKVRRSLVRFRQLVQQYPDPRQLHQAIQREFIFYRSVGKDGTGQVDFTAYFEPAYVASPLKLTNFNIPSIVSPPVLKLGRNPTPAV